MSVGHNTALSCFSGTVQYRWSPFLSALDRDLPSVTFSDKAATEPVGPVLGSRLINAEQRDNLPKMNISHPILDTGEGTNSDTVFLLVSRWWMSRPPLHRPGRAAHRRPISVQKESNHVRDM